MSTISVPSTATDTETILDPCHWRAISDDEILHWEDSPITHAIIKQIH